MPRGFTVLPFAHYILIFFGSWLWLDTFPRDLEVWLSHLRLFKAVCPKLPQQTSAIFQVSQRGKTWMFIRCFGTLWYIVRSSIQWASAMRSSFRLKLALATLKSLFTVDLSTRLNASDFISVWHQATACKMTPKHHTREKCPGRSAQDLPQFLTLQDDLIWNAAWVGSVAEISAVGLYHCDSVFSVWLMTLLLLCLGPGLSGPPLSNLCRLSN